MVLNRSPPGLVVSACRSLRVDLAVTVDEVAGCDILGVLGEQVLHLVGRQGRVLRQQSSDIAGLDGCRLRAARADEVLLVDDGLRVLLIEERSRNPEAHDRLARRQDIRGSVGVAAGGPCRRRVATSPRVVGLGGADREDVRRQRRAVDSADHVAAVARCGHDDDAGVPGPLDGCRERIAGGRRNAAGAE